MKQEEDIEADLINQEDLIFSALEEGAIYNIIADGGIVASGNGDSEIIILTSSGILLSGSSDANSTYDIQTDAGLNTSGLAFIDVNYSVDSSSGVLVSGNANNSADLFESTSGGIIGLGEASQNSNTLVKSMGGVIVNGTGSITGNLPLVLGGSAIITTLLYPMVNGGVSLSGSIVFLYETEFTGGVLTGGSAFEYVDFDLSGGLVLAGNSDYYLESSQEVTSVGLLISGDTFFETIYEPPLTGGLLAGGYSDVESLTFIGEGSTLLSGLAENTHIQEETNAQAVIIGGDVNVAARYFDSDSLISSGLSSGGSAEIALSVVMDGGSILSGNSNELKTTSEIFLGGIILQGQSVVQQDYSDILGSGGIKNGGKARNERLRYLVSNRSSFSRASSSPNIINKENIDPNKLIDPVGAITPKLPPQSLRGIPKQSYCTFDESCVEGWPKVPKVVLKRLRKYVPVKN